MDYFHKIGRVGGVSNAGTVRGKTEGGKGGTPLSMFFIFGVRNSIVQYPPIFQGAGAVRGKTEGGKGGTPLSFFIFVCSGNSALAPRIRGRVLCSVVSGSR